MKHFLRKTKLRRKLRNNITTSILMERYYTRYGI